MVGLTLLLIGGLGIYERFFDNDHDHDDGEELEKISELESLLVDVHCLPRLLGTWTSHTDVCSRS